jgi:hypothetical protein
MAKLAHAKLGHAFVLPLSAELSNSMVSFLFDGQGECVAQIDVDDHQEYALQLVRAANAHDDLVALLREAEVYCPRDARFGSELGDRISAALAKVEAGP